MTDHTLLAAIRGIEAQRRAGQPLVGLLEPLGVSASTYYRWRRRFEAQLVRDLEVENSRLRHVVADTALQLEALREITRGNW